MRMMKKLFPMAVSAAALMAIAAPQSAFAIVADGSVGDWGITWGAGSTYSYSTPFLTYSGLPPLGQTGFIQSTGLGGNPGVEDQPNTNGISGVVTPWDGGQRYDAEVLGVAVTNVDNVLAHARVSILVVSGMRPDNSYGVAGSSPQEFFGLGDIRILSTTGVYGVETGGGAGHNNTTEVSRQTTASNGTTYNLDLTGGTTGYIGTTISSTSNAVVTAGSLVKTSSNGNMQVPNSAQTPTQNGDATGWINDPLPNDQGSSSHHDTPVGNFLYEDDDRSQIQYNVGGSVPGTSSVVNANVQYVYTADEYYADGTLPSDHGGQLCDRTATSGPTQCSVHSVMEVQLDAAPFVDGNGNLIFSVDWGPSCNNDVLQVSVALTDTPHFETPEPGTLALLGMSLMGLGVPAWRRRRAARAA